MSRACRASWQWTSTRPCGSPPSERANTGGLNTMPELRWILLILGLLFIATLAWWEQRRQRKVPAPKDDRTPHHFREPSLGLPEMRPREPAPALPVVELEDDSMIGLRIDGVRIEEDTVELPALSET